jgi:uncharacterized protein YfaS (alpha-2-macroglobulin family)
MNILLSEYEDNDRKADIYLNDNKYKLILKESNKEYIKYFTKQYLAENEAENWVLKK